MIQYFRKIRKALLSDNKFTKYLIYAIGEIALVMIGILLALQVNNWNQQKQETVKIEGFYRSIIDEITENIDQGYSLIKRDSQLIISHQRSLNILNNQDIDSVEVLRDLLGATATVQYSRFNFPSSDEFLSLELLPKVNNSIVRQNFTHFSRFQESFESYNDYNRHQYTNAIEPFFIEHINYTDVAQDRYNMNFLVKGGPKTEFESLFTNLSLWNIITFKLETLSIQEARTRGFIDFLEKHRSDLESALDEL